MKLPIKIALVAGVVSASLGVPVSPASAASAVCTGIVYDQGQIQELGSWPCSCPASPIYGPLDGRFHVILCAETA